MISQSDVSLPEGISSDFLAGKLLHISIMISHQWTVQSTTIPNESYWYQDIQVESLTNNHNVYTFQNLLIHKFIDNMHLKPDNAL